MTQIDSKIFNTQKRDYANTPLLLGEEPGLGDTIHKQHREIWDLYKTLKSQDWDENEWGFAACNSEFKTCSRSVYDMMIKQLAWQWEADSLASRSILSVMGPFISSSELSAAWSEVTTNEVVHWATYSEIVRASFDNPRVVLDEVLAINEAFDRSNVIADIMAESHKVAHDYANGYVENNQSTYNAAYMYVVALYALERLQFMSSFAVTFGICDTGIFMPIGKAVQKIAMDEFEIHSELDRLVLKTEHQNARGQEAYKQCHARIQQAIDQVVEDEFAWIDYLYSDGRQLVGITPEALKKWVLFNAAEIYNFFRLERPYTFPRKNPFKFMENWLNLDKMQASPQEQQNGQYRVNVIRRDDADQEFAVDF